MSSINPNIFLKLESSEFIAYYKEKNWERIIGYDFNEKFQFFELSWQKNTLKLRVYYDGALLCHKEFEYTTDFDIEHVNFHRLNRLINGFCCASGHNITLFSIPFGYTSRILPFSVDVIKPIDTCSNDERNGFIIKSTEPYFCNCIFFLHPSLNELYPISIWKDGIETSITHFISFDYFSYDYVICQKNKSLQIYHAICTSRNNLDHLKRINDPQISGGNSCFLDLSVKKKYFNFLHDKSVMSNSSQTNLSTTFDSFHSSINNNSLKVQAQTFFDGNKQHEVVRLEKNGQFHFKIFDEIDSLAEIIVSENISQRRFLNILLKNNKLKIVSIENNSYVELTNIRAVFPIQKAKITCLLTCDDHLLFYHGDENLGDLVLPLPTFRIVSVRYDKVLLQSDEKFFIIVIPLYLHYYLTRRFFQSNTEEFDLLYSQVIQNWLNCPQKVQSFIDLFLLTICQNFNVTYNNTTIIDIDITKIINMVCFKKKSSNSYDYRSLFRFVESKHLNLLKKLIDIYFECIWTRFHDHRSLKLLMTILDNIYEHYVTSSPISFSKITDSCSSHTYMFTDPNLEYFSFSHNYLLHFYQTNNKENSTKRILSRVKTKSIFPVISNFSKEFDRCKTTKQYLDWSVQTLIASNSLEIFHPSRDASLNDADDDLRDASHNLQKMYLSCMLNYVYSKPIGQGCLNIGTGGCDSTECFFKLKIPPLCYDARMLIRYDDNEPFLMVVKLDINEIDKSSSEWPRFHHGVAHALTHVASIENFQRNTCRTLECDSWIQMAIDSILPQEVGGFLFGCGMKGYLRHSITNMPGALMNYFLKNSGVAVAGILLGLAASNIGNYNTDSISLKRLTSMFFIHSGLSKYVSTPNEFDSKKFTQNTLSFNAERPKFKRSTQMSSIVSLGLFYLRSHNDVMLEIFNHFFEDLLVKTTRLLVPTVCVVGGRIPGDNIIYSFKPLAISVGIAIGLISDYKNLNNNQIKVYQGWIDSLNDSNHLLLFYIESIFIMIGLTYLDSSSEDAFNLLTISHGLMERGIVRPNFLCLSFWFKGLVCPHKLSYKTKSLRKHLPMWIFNTINNKRCSFDLKLTYAWSALTGWLYALCVHNAGTFDDKILKLVRKYIKKLRRIINLCDCRWNVGNTFVGSIFKDCMVRLLLGMSVVFAGSNRADIKDIINKTRIKNLPKIFRAEHYTSFKIQHFASIYSGNYGYGFHSALNMALGIVCLGNGYATFDIKPHNKLITLVLSLYPIFSAVPSDGNVYVEPLRHFYCLSTVFYKTLIFVENDKSPIRSKTLKLSIHYDQSRVTKPKCKYVLKSSSFILTDLDSIEKICIKSQDYERVTIFGDILRKRSKYYSTINYQGSSFLVFLKRQYAQDVNLFKFDQPIQLNYLEHLLRLLPHYYLLLAPLNYQFSYDLRYLNPHNEYYTSSLNLVINSEFSTMVDIFFETWLLLNDASVNDDLCSTIRINAIHHHESQPSLQNNSILISNFVQYYENYINKQTH